MLTNLFRITCCRKQHYCLAPREFIILILYFVRALVLSVGH